ncbi:MAG: penicillin-binding protein, partial [Anaerolineales bacterium]
HYLSVDPAQAAHFSPHLIQVVVALLEPDFWSSPGFSPGHFTQEDPVTIAEHLAHDLLLNAEPEETRKAIRMRLLAAQLVSQYGRAQVLEWFLNSAYFGHLAYGADQAAVLYFDKDADQLNLAEAALLGSLLSTPSLNPMDAPQAAVERANETLDRLEVSGYFSATDIAEARAADLILTAEERGNIQTPDPFIQFALRQAADLLDLSQIERGGLRIITTLNAGLQEQLLCTVDTQLDRLVTSQTSSETIPENCQAAFLLPTRANGTLIKSDGEDHTGSLLANALILNPETAEILAWSGEQNNSGAVRTQTQYQAGSLITPFVAAAAFARGFSPASLVWDVPADTQTDPADTAVEIPDQDGIYLGPMHLRSALANDYLAPIARLADQVGYENIWLLAKTLGLENINRDQMKNYLANGSAPVSILEIAQAYSTFANSGTQVGLPSSENGLQPAAVLRIEDRYGRVIYAMDSLEKRPLLSPGLAYLVNDVLSDPIARRPSLGHPNALEISRPAGAKIGWVDMEDQVWTVGYTPELLAVVWLGFVQNVENKPGGEISPDIAAGIWHAIMQYATQNEPVQEWQQPPDVVSRTVCSPSGKLPTSSCPTTVSELFLLGSEPVVTDTLYRIYAINRETGLLATVFTPLELIDEQTFFIPPAEYQPWAAANGYPQPPNDYDLIQKQEPPAGVEISEPAPISYVHGIVPIRGTAAGDQFVAYRIQVGQGLNPRTWVQIGQESEQVVQYGVLGEWDTSGLDGLYVIRLTVLRTQNRLESHVIQVSVDNTPPTALITYPAPAQEFQYRADGDILFLAEANDSLGVKKVAWFVDGEPAGEQVQAPYYLQWKMAKGEHTLQVQVFDLAGNTTLSEETVFQVN